LEKSIASEPSKKRNYLFVSYDGLIGDLAWCIIQEGHSVKYSISNPDDREVGSGFVPMIDDWRSEVE